MTSTSVASSFGRDSVPSPPQLGIYAFGIGLAAAPAALVLLASAAFALGDDARDLAVMLGAAALLAGCSFVILRRGFDPRRLRPVPALAATTVSFVFLAFVSTLVYLLTGAITRFDDALYESVAGVSTSSLTLFDDPSSLSDSVLIWRSGTQWLGGLGALALAIGVLPFLGGSKELADPRGSRAQRLALAPRPAPALRRVAALYGIVSVVVIVVLLAVGLSLHDSVAHMMSTVSTGGFSTHADSIAHFDSRLVEVVTIVVMAGAGFSLALVWMLSRRQFHDTRRVFELWVYAAVLTVSSVWVYWLQAPDDTGVVRRALDAVFATVSMSTTTGHRTADWGLWGPGALMLLVMLFVIGGMSGSVAGGLRWFRVIGLLQFVWRELQHQLHPRAVRTVKVGTTAISEDSIARWYSQLVLTVIVGGLGGILLGFFGDDVLESLTLAFSAVSTTGIGLSDDGLVTTAAHLSRLDRLVLMPMMLMGRVAIYPALVLVSVLWFGGGRQLSAARRRSATR